MWSADGADLGGGCVVGNIYVCAKTGPKRPRTNHSAFSVPGRPVAAAEVRTGEGEARTGEGEGEGGLPTAGASWVYFEGNTEEKAARKENEEDEGE